MQYKELVKVIADLLKSLDEERPVHKNFKPGIGPFGEPQLVRELAKRLSQSGIHAQTKLSPDLSIEDKWAIEIKIARPYGDNGKQAENWSVNLLHPYPGNTSLIGDAIKLRELNNYKNRGLLVIGYEHDPAKISLDPLIHSFELIADRVMDISLAHRIEERRPNLVHPDHQVLRCIGWGLRR